VHSAGSPQSESKSDGNRRGRGSSRSAGAVRIAGHLDLSYNDICETGAGSLAQVLGQCRALVSLDLGNNLIGTGGAGKLAGGGGRASEGGSRAQNWRVLSRFKEAPA
jgi:hypothetical protein